MQAKLVTPQTRHKQAKCIINSRMARTNGKAPNKYVLYENAVQDTPEDVKLFNSIFRKTLGYAPVSLREDFCGTHMLACDWVKSNAKRTAIAHDIDSEPLEHGQTNHYSKLNAAQKKRLKVFKKDVRSITKPGVDLTTALNFSYWIFKEREQLKKYFKQVHKSLKTKGLFILDAMGGSETMEITTDRERFNIGKRTYTYYWDQEYFNTINHHGNFSISFKLPNGERLNKAFEYDWRLWSLPELTDILKEAGFKDVHIYWEGDDDEGGGSGEFSKITEEENCEVWIAYLVATKT
jgi:hypothetical protein